MEGRTFCQPHRGIPPPHRSTFPLPMSPGFFLFESHVSGFLPRIPWCADDAGLSPLPSSNSAASTTTTATAATSSITTSCVYRRNRVYCFGFTVEGVGIGQEFYLAFARKYTPKLSKMLFKLVHCPQIQRESP